MSQETTHGGALEYIASNLNLELSIGPTPTRDH